MDETGILICAQKALNFAFHGRGGLMGRPKSFRTTLRVTSKGLLARSIPHGVALTVEMPARKLFCEMDHNFRSESQPMIF